MAQQEHNLFDKEVEESVIGSVLVDPGCFPLLDLGPQHFYIRRLGCIWEAFQRLHSKDVDIDFLTVRDELERAGKLAEVGGEVYLAEVVNSVPTSQNVEHYVQIVKDYASRRALRNLAVRIAKTALDKDSKLDLEVGRIMNELTGSLTVRQGAVHISQFTRELRKEVQERAENPQEVWGIPTGFIDFDRITGGLQKGEILYLSGDPGIGKSMLAMQAGFQMAANKHPGAIYSLEMPGKAVVRRRVSHMGHIPSRAMKTGEMNDQFWIEFDAAIQTIDDLPLYMSDEVYWTTASIRADLARLKALYGIEWFVLDYALLLQDEGVNETEKTGFISAQNKGICRSLNLAGIAILSENKEGMDDDAKKPKCKTGKGLRGSGQQFYDTDLLLFLNGGMQENVVMCQFGKGRELEQPKQVFDLIRLPGFPAFENAVARHVDVNGVVNGNGYKPQPRASYAERIGNG